MDNIYITFGAEFNGQIVDSPMDTNSAPLVVDLFLFPFDRDSMTFLAGIIEAIIPTATHLDDILILKILIAKVWSIFIHLNCS